MEKLLHERLRDSEGRIFLTCNTKDIADVTGCRVDDCRLTCEECRKRVFNAIADEIERSYIPRPRYEDGEPVQFGDEFVIDRYMWEPETLIRLVINTKEQLEEWNQYQGIDPVYEMNFVRPNCEDGKEPIIKRPQPKVLDAEGVPINGGDEVWNIESGRRYTVGSLPKRGCYQSVEVFYWGDNGIKYTDGFDPDRLTHKEPVLDADGVPINIGDTVWFAGSSKIKMKVIDINEFVIAEVIEGSIIGKNVIRVGIDFTHKEPDSLEKLRDRMHIAWQRMWADHEPLTEQEMHNFIDDLTALIERGA